MAHIAAPHTRPLADGDQVISFELLDDLVDDVNLWGRDPFDIVAAYEEELGYPIHDD
jgi:hypothetical protein